ncbi:MAG: aldehyde dehydrogenase family protein [Methanomicrobiaceae archaeon]|nr:aldehyde dehydrogenase family protein [Methanomicrobiaceae archaeon]
MKGKEKITYTSLLADSSIHGKFEDALEKIGQRLGQHHPMFIGEKGIFSNEEFPTRSPLDSEIIIGHFQKGTGEDARKAVRAAKDAFVTWSSTDWRERVRIIRECANTLDRQKFLLAALICYEIGKTRTEALAEVGEAIDFLRYYAGHYESREGYITPLSSGAPGEEPQSVMKPHGVWAVISPFNFPVALAAGMASAALLTGNTVVMKPTSLAPYSALRLYQAFISSGIPPGALNVVTGPGEPFGDAIVGNRDVDGIAFTGSRSVGMWLYRSFASSQPYPIPVVLELGSKNPVIVTAHAEIEKAVEGVVRAAFGYSGQKCSAASRLYLERSIADPFLEALTTRIGELRVGDPREKEVFTGPVITRKALTTFRNAVDEAKRDGGKVLAGGSVLERGIFGRGNYAVPTVISDLSPEHRLFTEELFVPILAVDTFTTLREALDKANNTEFGLTAGIFSEKEAECEYFFDHIKFGVTYSNRKGGATTGAWPGAQPFGGWKGSGSTGRGVGGPHYLLSFMREQAQTRVNA